MKRRQRCGKSGIPSGHGSKFEGWFAASTKPPSRQVLAPARSQPEQAVHNGQLSAADERCRPGSAGAPSSAVSQRGPLTVAPMAKKLVIVEIACKGADDRGLPRAGLRRRVEHRPHPRPPEARRRRARGDKKKSWARLGVDVENDFEPLYVVDADKKAKVADLKKQLKDADELLLATDEDREGEAIAWHLLEVLKPKVPVRRMVFHEITRDAIERALGETREIDERLVDAQETRRILDRLYGYEVSPVLWKKVMQGLSAGRVQSVATRLVVERERERRAFVAAGYWDIKGVFDPGSFEARLVALDGKRVAQGRDFAQRRRRSSRTTWSRLDEAHGARARGGARRRHVRRPLRRREAVHAPAGRAVHDLDAAAGGEPQAPLHVADDDARRAAPVRERLHHLHAHRLDDALRVGAHGGARQARELYGAESSRRSRAATPQGEERAGGARGDPSRRRLLPHAEGGRAAS